MDSHWHLGRLPRRGSSNQAPATSKIVEPLASNQLGLEALQILLLDSRTSTSIRRHNPLSRDECMCQAVRLGFDQTRFTSAVNEYYSIKCQHHTTHYAWCHIIGDQMAKLLPKRLPETQVAYIFGDDNQNQGNFHQQYPSCQ